MTIFALVLLGIAAAITARRIGLLRVESSAVAPELVILPTLVGGRSFKVTLVIAIALLTAVMVRALNPVTQHPQARWPIAAALVSFAAAVIAPADWKSGALLVALGVLVYTSLRVRSRASVISSLYDGLAVYLLVNVLARAVGVTSPASANRIGGLESLNGTVRIIYPLGSGLNFTPALAGAFVASSLLMFEGGSRRQILRIAGAVAAVVVLIGADARTPLITAAVIAVTSVVAPRILSRVAVPLTAGALLLALFYNVLANTVITPVLGGLFRAAPGLSRGSVTADLSLDGRAFIWSQALNSWKGYTSAHLFNQIFGFGAFGQRTSGASNSYASELNSVSADPTAASVHNSMLQELFDSGVVGVVAFVALALYGTHRLAVTGRAGDPRSLCGLSMLLAVTLSGMTEVSLSPGYGVETLWVFLVLVLCTCFGPDKKIGYLKRSLSPSNPENWQLRSLGHVDQS